MSGNRVVLWLNVAEVQLVVEWHPEQSWLKLFVTWLGFVVPLNSVEWHA